MTHKEAIYVIKNNWPDSSYTRLREALETLIPELKESEDESLRNRLLSRLDYWAENGSDADREEISAEKAWLEKQGEQKPIEWNADDLLKHNQIMDILQEYNRTELITWLEKHKKQKPVDLPKGEDYGIDGLGNAIRILEKTLGEVDGYQTDDGILEHKCAISAVKELYEKKSAWSLDDENYLIDAIIAFGYYYGDSYTEKLGGWLKSIRERYTWKPSDEQMSALRHCCNGWQDNADGRLESLYNDLKKLKDE